MSINPIHLNEAEGLLIKGNKFDPERLIFINNLDTCDLLAVPGSGKTTALMAKLFALSRQLPFTDGSGILVLAHTNAAVDEIENKLKKYCLQLFEYPNFIGTIQSFVNKFLANPANFLKYNSNIFWNDNYIYEKEAINYYYSLRWSAKGVEPKNLKNKLFGRINAGKNIEISEGEENIKKFLQYFEFDILNRKIIYNNQSFYTYDGASQRYYLELENWKEGLLRKGILSYKDSYYLAEWFLHNYAIIKETLQNRFKYVFIDEMQDLEKFQIDIIDKIFFYDNSPTLMQRVGDINQAIYNSGKQVKVECDWKSREEENPEKFKDLFLTGSNRLSKTVAELVNCFTLDDRHGRFEVNGLRKLENNDIPPHLIVFNNQITGDILKNKFKELIKKFNLNNSSEVDKEFKIIGWVGERENEGDGNLCLSTIFGYKKEIKVKKEEYDTLSKHLQLFNKEKKTLESIRKSILNAFIKILRLENIKIIKEIREKRFDRYYSKSDLIEYIKNYSNEEENYLTYEKFKLFLLRWCFIIVTKNDGDKVYKSIVKFINNHFIKWFDIKLFNSETLIFIGEKFEIMDNILPDKASFLNNGDLNIEVGTIHSVKGQTHCATMYVETYNHGYESLKIKSKKPFFKEKHDCSKKYDREALKMLYVGFSRPTHLLCYAALHDNVKDDIEKFKNAGWEIINLT